MRKPLGALVAGAMLLALPACGNKTDETARAAGITPADALAFLSVSLDPSIEQKRNLIGIARRFPGAEVRDDFDESRDELLSSILEQAGLDYERDVKPWLGSELALAVLPGPGGSAPLVAVLIEQDDEDQATAALDKANARGESDGGPAIAYRLVDEFVVATDGSDAARADDVLEAFAAQAEQDEGDLSRSKEFTDVVDRLHGDRLLLGWFDGKDALAQLGEALGDDIPVEGLLEEVSVAAFDVHVARSAVVMEAVAPATDETTGGRPELTEGLPQDSFGALTVFDIQQLAREGMRAVAGAEVGNVLADFQRETGLDLEADLLSWMGGEAVLVAAPGEELPNVGLIVEPTDRAAAEAALPKIRDALARLRDAAAAEGVQPAVELFDDRFVLASSAEYLERLSKDASPSFGESDSYGSVLGESSVDATRFQLLVDIDAVREAIEGFLEDDDRAAYERDTLPNVEPLDAVGMVVHREDGFDYVELKLTFD